MGAEILLYLSFWKMKKDEWKKYKKRRKTLKNKKSKKKNEKNAVFLYFDCKDFLIQICMNLYFLFGRVGNSAYITTSVILMCIAGPKPGERRRE
jgi:hypothetical protein